MLNGKVALITGASRGIGRAIALKLASLGADVALCYVGGQQAAEETAALARALGVRAKAYRCDVADFSSALSLVQQVNQEFGFISILINNAGITRDKLIMRLSEEDFDRVLAVDLKGAFNLIRHTSAAFMKNRAGRIINISSVVGLSGNAGQSNYAAAKAGLIGLTKSVARELAPRGVTCNAIAPGFIQTDMTDAIPRAAREECLRAIPAQRAGAPEDVAEAVAFLCSDQASYITGAVLPVDGGMSM